MQPFKSPLYASALTLLFTTTALADPAPLQVSVSGIDANGRIADKHAYCIPDGKGKSIEGPNYNPQISWSGAPEGTKSYVLLVVDSEVPSDLSKAYSDTVITADAPRRNFYHWVLFDIPAHVTTLEEGQNSSKLATDGKPVGKTGYGINARNDYGAFKEKVIGGYDGPCPPWNDEKMHRYHFRVYALDTATLFLPDDTDGNRVIEAMKPHILAQGEITGLYTLNAGLLKK